MIKRIAYRFLVLKIIFSLIFSLIFIEKSFAKIESFNLRCNENYLWLLDLDIKSIKNSNDSIVKVNSIVTIDNQKNQIILQALKLGRSVISFELKDNRVKEYEIEVRKKAKFMCQRENLFVLDKALTVKELKMQSNRYRIEGDKGKTIWSI